MNKMFRFLSMAALLAVVGIMTGCSSDDSNNNKQPSIDDASLITAPVVGQVIGSDGKNYNAGSVLPSGVTAVAMIAYVGAAGTADASSTTYKGLALALSDVSSSKQWCIQYVSTCLGSDHQYGDENAAKADMAGIANTDALVNHTMHTHAAASAARNFKYADSVVAGAHPTGTSAWFLPSVGQWDKMAIAAGSYANLATNANLREYRYWSSTECTFMYVWNFSFYYSRNGYWGRDGKDMDHYLVRPCLAF